MLWIVDVFYIIDAMLWIVDVINISKRDFLTSLLCCLKIIYSILKIINM